MKKRSVRFTIRISKRYGSPFYEIAKSGSTFDGSRMTYAEAQKRVQEYRLDHKYGMGRDARFGVSGLASRRRKRARKTPKKRAIPRRR